MKLLTLNFLCCARKTCKTNPAAFPLHPKDAELEQVEAEINPLLIQNMLPRINWEALKTISQEVRIPPSNPPEEQIYHLQRDALLTPITARPAQPTRPSARARSSDHRGQRADADAQGLAHAADGDERAEWQVGVWQLRARVCGEGGDCELFVA